MSTNYPGALDALTNPAATDGLTGHAAQHANANDAIEALEAKVGVDNSTDPASLDYRVASVETGKANSTHAHALGDVTGLTTALSGKLDATEKGVANGLAPLGADSKISATYLPSYVDDVSEAANFAALPATGEAGKIYVTIDTNKTYRWSGSAYIEISASPGSTDAVTEGASNLYFTYTRVRDTVLTGLSTATSAVIAATDSVLSALGKLQAQITGHTGNTSNPHGVTKTQVGLGNVDNTADMDKPVSTAQAAADVSILNAAKTDATTKANAAQAASTPIAHASNTENPHSVTKAQVGLGNVDNTSDANKPISTATQTALDDKSATGHGHTVANVTGLQTALDGKSATGHAHAVSDVTTLQTALNSKQAALVSGTNIKTVNGVSVLGSGDLPITEFTGTVHTGSMISRNVVVGQTATNLLLWSEQFSNSVWNPINVSINSNSVLSPDGSISAAEITATGSESYLIQELSTPGVGAHTFSIYLKSPTAQTVWLRIGERPDYLFESENVQLSTEWTRFTITRVGSENATGLVVVVLVGAGGSSTPGSVIHAYHAQLETGSVATDYIKTEASPVMLEAKGLQTALDAKVNATDPTSSGAITHTGNVLVNGTALALSWVAGGTSTAKTVIGAQNTANSLLLNTPSLSASYASGLGVDGTYAAQESRIRIHALGVKSTGGYKSSLSLHTTLNDAEYERVVIDSAGNMGIGETVPEAKLHVRTVVTAGPVPHANGNTAVFESGNSNGVSVLVPDASSGLVMFGSPSSNRGAEVQWNYDLGKMTLGTRKVGGLIEFMSGNGSVAATIDATGNMLVTNPARLGYGIGAGGTVNQATSKSTQVTLNKPSGQITMNAASLAAGATVIFALSNTLISLGDTVSIDLIGGISSGTNYRVDKYFVGAGIAGIRVTNLSAGALAEALVLAFNIVKGASS